MWNKCSGNTTSFTKKSHHALALPDLVQCLLCLSYGFLSSVLYCYGGISQNAPSINLRHFVSVRRSRNFGRARKTASKKVSKIGVRVGGEHERAQDWAYGGNDMIMLRKAICHVRYINILTWLRGFQDKLLSIDLYHAAAILSPRGTKSFVFARPASHWMRGWTGKIFCFSIVW